ncbi:hypothetical protein F4009_13135 [Candidatus Poribacteria bacterium]|nr:hypothetical protein [Candidatus Poribacteria bacterium]MYH80150.1 hypothetical protein [Candidatus Poribacteria bacterium]MYK94918.1 hypothetical protein [Candidatus Poribacteria bacterium]
MGTSTNYKAPTSPQWKKLKGKVTRLTGQGSLSSTSRKEIVRDYVNVNYGSSRGTTNRGRAARRRAAQSVAQSIGGFFSSVASEGFQKAFEDAGLGSLEGKTVSEIAHSLLDHLGGPSNTLDEADARTALCDLMDEILNDADGPEDVEEVMEMRTHGVALDNLLRRFFGYYIYEQFCKDFYGQLVANIGNKEAAESIDEIRDYVCEALKEATGDQEISQIDWDGSQGQQIVEEILQETLEVFSE